MVLAHLSDGSGTQRSVAFAANQAEAVAYEYSGRLLWRTPTADMSPVDRVGAVTALSFRDDGHVVLTTSRGWVVLLSALGGQVVDAYRMDADVAVGSRRHHGTFVNLKASVVIGNALYLMTKFRPARPALAPGLPKAVFLVRLGISPGSSRRGAASSRWPTGARAEVPDRLQVGVTRLRGGSPCAWPSPLGNMVLVNSDQLVDGRLVPSGDVGPRRRVGPPDALARPAAGPTR